MSGRLVLGGLAVLAASAAGCVPRETIETPGTGNLERIEVDARVRADGVVESHLVVRYRDGSGGILVVPDPAAADTIAVTVDGEPPRGTPGAFDTVEVPVTERRADAVLEIDGLVAAGPNVTVVELPLIPGKASDISRQDKPVPISGTLTLPEAVAASDVDPHWQTGIDPKVSVDGNVVTFSGASPPWTGSQLVVGLPGGAVAGAEERAAPTRADYATRVAGIDETSAQLASTLSSQDRDIDIGIFLLSFVSLGFSALVVGVFIWMNLGGAAERRRILARVPRELPYPPDDLDPALVALVHGDGHRLDRDAVAGTVLDLAHRRVVAIDGLVAGRYRVRVRDRAKATTPNDAHSTDAVTLDALRAQPADAVAPPLWPDRRWRWWRAYRRSVYRRAKDRHLVERRLKALFVGPCVTGLAVGTWPYWGQDHFWLVPIVAVASSFLFGILVYLPLGVRYRLTTEGVLAQGRWRALARWSRAHGELGDLSAPAVAVWGPYLAYGAVLGVARRAAAELAPASGRERERYRTIAAELADEEAVEETVTTPAPG
jgi:hypothetical protein